MDSNCSDYDLWFCIQIDSELINSEDRALGMIIQNHSQCLEILVLSVNKLILISTFDSYDFELDASEDEIIMKAYLEWFWLLEQIGYGCILYSDWFWAW